MALCTIRSFVFTAPLCTSVTAAMAQAQQPITATQALARAKFKGARRDELRGAEACARNDEWPRRDYASRRTDAG
jgi:hypothetical protein